MLSQPTVTCKRNDVVQTPPEMVKSIVDHFRPYGKVLEPCKGQGNFLLYLEQLRLDVDWCELSEGRDFYNYRRRVDWIITNPPWSKITPFLEHSLRIADHVVFLVTLNHLFTQKRQRLLKEYGFGIRQVVFMDWPDKSSGFPRSGFSLGCVHLERDYTGPAFSVNL